MENKDFKPKKRLKRPVMRDEKEEHPVNNGGAEKDEIRAVLKLHERIFTFPKRKKTD